MTEPEAPFTAYWRRAFGVRDAIDPATAAEAVERLAPWLGRTLARAPVAQSVPEDPSETHEAAYQRLVLARQTATVAALRTGGLQVLPIKGYDAARLYHPPWVRIVGDLDLLVRPGDAAAAVGELGLRGFAIERSPQGALGVTSDVSFHPMVSPDGLVSVDLHTALDAFPLSAALPAEAVLEAAIDGPAVPHLAPHHAALASLSNLAKERFAPYALRHLVDLGRLAVAERVDWPQVARVVQAAGLGRAGATTLGALLRLGVPADRLPAGVDPRFPPAARLAEQLGRLRLADPGRLAKVGREIAWCYDPGTVARLWWFRAAGLLRPRTGLPPGAAVQQSDGA